MVEYFELDVEGEREKVGGGGLLWVFGDEDVVFCKGQLYF